jgi:hypothetical protein
MTISPQDIFKQVRKDAYMGYKTPKIEKDIKLDSKLPPRQMDSTLTEDEYIILQQYSRFLPAGNRKLKLNLPELRDTLIATDLAKAPLSKTDGLNSGGNISLLKGKTIKSKSQAEYIYKLKNGNKLPGNPNPTSFKNDIKF